MSMIRANIASEPDVLHQLMSSLFNTLLLSPHANHWAVTRPILSLMLASEASFAGNFLCCTELCCNLLSTLLYSTQLYSTFYSTLLDSTLLQSILLLHCVAFYPLVKLFASHEC